MQNEPSQLNLESLQKSPFLRLILIAFLILLLQIPILMIDKVIWDRQSRQQEAVEDITSKWGQSQTILGPTLVVPYTIEIQEKNADGSILIRTEQRQAKFLPDTLNVTGNIQCESRYRGIYHVPVYTMDLVFSGQFTRPDFSVWEVDPNRILWDRAYLTLQIQDARAITEQIAINWNNAELDFLPGMGDFGGGSSGIHVPLKSRLEGTSFPFSFPLALNGSQSVYFAPFGRNTTVNVQSNWQAPSFQGTWLPSYRTLTSEGFEAGWSIPFLGRNYPQQWKDDPTIEKRVYDSLFGVHFISPMDHYRMAQRSTKYGILFLVLTFATLWLFEILARIRIHSLQYLFVGVGMCMFYLLELSLSEHIGFFAAYFCASASVVLLISSYCITVLRGINRAVIVAGAVTLLYGYLYILLMNQDYALLIGSVGLFLILAAIMYLTRKIDWYAFGR